MSHVDVSAKGVLRIDQLDLFASGTVPLGMPRPRTRRSDPDTSYQAAKRHDRALRGQAAVVLAEIERQGGQTAGEIARSIAGARGESFGAWRYRVSRRTADLERKGLVRKGAARTCAALGSMGVTWWVA